MNSARIINEIAKNMARTKAGEDAFFAKGPMATYLKQQALSLAYFRKINYEDALQQIHRDFALQGTPYESKIATTPSTEQLHILSKYFEDKRQDRPRLDIAGTSWYIEGAGTPVLKCSHEVGISFDSVNLYSGSILYNHELEGVSVRFKHFLTMEDCQAFNLLVSDIKKYYS